MRKFCEKSTEEKLIMIYFKTFNAERSEESEDRGNATSPAQLLNLILFICGSARPQRASKPPPNSLPRRIYSILNICIIFF